MIVMKILQLPNKKVNEIEDINERIAFRKKCRKIVIFKRKSFKFPY